MPDYFEIPQLNKENELDAIFKIYLSEGKHVRRLSEHTIKGYSEVYLTFKKIVPEATCVEDIHPQLIQEFFKRLGTRVRKVGSKTKVGIKPSTTSTYYNKLMAFFRWLEEKGYITEGYLSKSIRRPPTPIYNDERALTDDEVSKIIASISINTVDNTFLHKRDIAMVSSLLYTGVRKGELLGLRVHDIDFKQQQIFVNHATSKSKADRLIPLHPTLSYHLKEYLKELRKHKRASSYLFVSSKSDNALTKNGLKHWVKRYRALSKVPFHLHRFRHTFACTLAKNGADLTSIMKLLGHTSSRMTERYLRSISTKDARVYVDKLNF
ncbi:MAG: site-specific integrase [Flavobacteriaceae bacterium]